MVINWKNKEWKLEINGGEEMENEEIELDGAFGTDDYEYLQEYVEEYGRHMNDKKFESKYGRKSMLQRLKSERTADVFEIEERKLLEDEEGEDYYYQ